MQNSQTISFTDAVIKHFEKILAHKEQAKGIRLRVKKSGCSGYAYVLEVADTTFNPAANDLIIQSANVTVFVDFDSLDFLSGTLVDVIDKGLGQKQVVFNNPNVMDACGCGESFTVKEEGKVGV